ncbi:hypothetical protein NEMIN01_0621 [Nematocida minor]|uniref:uncharacterized protein n=1 Tax=Nematocida minor TaxID=1912983 RepID=UPI00222036B2|nr:uncharacterized protein NEMIN01_0621 [Nematocida minor]KAI5189668.1 hypothetical protein NEMIN01_0621 [Nematocida minor]
MECLKGMYYIDYILYVYIELAIEKNPLDRKTALHSSDKNMQSSQEAPYRSNSPYFASLISSLKSKLESKGCELEEETVLKYVLFLIHNNILLNFFAPDANRKFYKVFDYLKSMPEGRNTPIKRVIIWGHKILLENTKDREWARYSSLNTEECDKMIAEIIETSNTKDVLAEKEVRQKYFEEFKEQLLQETVRIYDGLGVPLLATMGQPSPVEETVEEVVNFREIVMGTDKMLWSGKSAAEFEEYKQASRIDTELERRRKRDLARKEFAEKYKSIKIDSLLNSNIKGVEVEWNESEIDEKAEKNKSAVSHAESLAAQENRALDQSFKENIKKTRKKKKNWLPAETAVLINAINVYGRAWDVVLEKCNFENVTKEQIVDKYKSLVKSNKIARVPPRA